MPRNKELTSNEKNVLTKYREHVEATGQAPTKNGLARDCGLHISSVRACYKTLKDKGYMKEEAITVVRLTLSAKAKRAAL